MKLFWNFACEIYTELIQIGFTFPPSQRFFNQPEIYEDFQIIEEIHADISFPENERHCIRQAAKDFEYFCNQRIVFDIIFDLEHDDQQRISEEPVLVRASKKHPIIVETDGYHKCNILGLCQFRKNNNAIYMVHDRLSNYQLYRTTAIHELGHFIGMHHVGSPSVMYKYNSGNVLYPTYIDAIEFAKLYDCKAEDLRYFKLT